jgi:hypothetical protein
VLGIDVREPGNRPSWEGKRPLYPNFTFSAWRTLKRIDMKGSGKISNASSIKRARGSGSTATRSVLATSGAASRKDGRDVKTRR